MYITLIKKIIFNIVIHIYKKELLRRFKMFFLCYLYIFDSDIHHI